MVIIIISCAWFRQRANPSPSTQIFLFQETTLQVLFPSYLLFCLQHCKHKTSTQAFKGITLSCSHLFSLLSKHPRFLQATGYTRWQIQECLYRFLSSHMFWKHAGWVVKQGKGESQALKRSKTGLPLLVLKQRWSPSAKARGPFEVSVLWIQTISSESRGEGDKADGKNWGWTVESQNVRWTL